MGTKPKARHILQNVLITIGSVAADPADPPAGEAVIFVSDGTGSGDDGDLMVKITDSSGVTATATLVDYSGL